MLNKQILIGRVGQDPQVKMESEDKGYARFSVATSETWTDALTHERKEATTWHKCVAWGHLASIVDRYVRKGMMLYVEGPTVHRMYQGSDGADREAVEVKVTEMKMLSRNEESAAPSAAPSQPNTGRPDVRTAQGEVRQAQAKEAIKAQVKEAFAEDVDPLPF